MPPKRRSWDKIAMVNAIKACREKTMGYKKSARSFGVPQTTLERYVKMNGDPEQLVMETKMGKKPIFTPDLVNHLRQHCMEMELSS